MSEFRNYLRLVSRINIDKITFPSDEYSDGSSPFNTYLILAEYRESTTTISTDFECYFSMLLDENNHTNLNRDMYLTFITSDNEVYVETIVANDDIISTESGNRYDLNEMCTEEGLFQQSTVLDIDCTCADVIELRSMFRKMREKLYELRVQAYKAHGKEPFVDFYEED